MMVASTIVAAARPVRCWVTSASSGAEVVLLQQVPKVEDPGPRVPRREAHEALHRHAAERVFHRRVAEVVEQLTQWIRSIMARGRPRSPAG